MSFMSLSSNQKFLSSEANTAKNHAPTKDTVQSTRSLVRGLHARITLIRARFRVIHQGVKRGVFLFLTIFRSLCEASWLARSTSERAAQVQALAGDIVLCSWARHFNLTEPLSTQVHKWVPVNLMLGVNLQWTSIPSRGVVEILLVVSCY